VRGFRIEEKKAQALARRLQAASARHETRRKPTFFPKFVSLRPENNSSLTYDIDFFCETAFWPKNPQISTGSLLVTGGQSIPNSGRIGTLYCPFSLVP
jgi:hypothetical protein